MPKQKIFGYCTKPNCGAPVTKTAGYTSGNIPKPRYRCEKGHRVTSLSSDPVPMREELPKVKRYIFTSAQNATPIHPKTWASLLVCKDYYNAELGVIPGRYKNPTSIWTANNKKHEWWAPEVVPYLFKATQDLNERLVVLGDAKIEWASGTPLNQLDAITQDKSGIVGHGQRALRSVATPQHKHPKIMMTTGACTIDGNYTDTARGRVANFNHCLGGIIVEVDGDTFYARQLNACKDGTFIDLDMEFTPDGVRPAERALALSMGDTHHRWIRDDVVATTFDNKNSMVNLLCPRHLMWHDLVDQYARNHHHKGDWVTEYGIWKENIGCIRTEIQDVVNFVNKKTPEDCKSVIIPSNHDEAVKRWLLESDPRKDPVNLDFYFEVGQQVLKTVHKGKGGVTYKDPFILYGELLADKKVRFLRRGESFVLKDVEYGLHGDIGPNGSRGTTNNLSKIGVKVTKGHNHTAEIIKGCYSAGKSAHNMEYERGGPSSHSNAHIVQYANGKRAILFVINGKYCLPRPKKKIKKEK